jgi:hypothetical protein
MAVCAQIEDREPTVAEPNRSIGGAPQALIVGASVMKDRSRIRQVACPRSGLSLKQPVSSYATHALVSIKTVPLLTFDRQY